MNRFLFIIFFFFSAAVDVHAQIFPKEGSLLNYKLISFTPFTSSETGHYKIEIAMGDHSNLDSFRKNIFKTVSGRSRSTTIKVPYFGTSYTWRSVTAGNAKVVYGSLHHFSTQKYADSSSVRLLVTVPSPKKYEDAFVFLDDNRAMYDMNGELLWFLPSGYGSSSVRDLKATEFGTITFLAGDEAYEIDYNGAVLWKGPNNGKVSGDKKEYYHHELTRLKNGHYMVLGNEEVYCKPASTSDSGFFILMDKKQAADSDLTKIFFGTIIEYDKNGNVLWSWKSSDYYRHSDLSTFKSKESIDNVGITDMHENAFYFDEKEKVIYLSFKNISRIVKIKYPEGSIIDEYGEKYRSGIALKGNGMFSNQHACKRSSLGCLFLFNNNGSNKAAPPKVKFFKEPITTKESLKKVWEYDCQPEPGVEPVEVLSGGNVIELKDTSVFVCIGGAYGKVFILNKDKEVLWSATSQRWDTEGKSWRPLPQYRASIFLDRKKIEKLLRNTKK